MSNEKPTPYVLRALNLYRRSNSFSKPRPAPLLSCISINTRLHERRNSNQVSKTKRETSSRFRSMYCGEVEDPDFAIESKLTPLNKRPNVRVIQLNRQQDSPDYKTTTDSEVYKSYTQAPQIKENDYDNSNPKTLMNELHLLPESSRRTSTRSRIRVRPVLIPHN